MHMCITLLPLLYIYLIHVYMSACPCGGCVPFQALTRRLQQGMTASGFAHDAAQQQQQRLDAEQGAPWLQLGPRAQQDLAQRVLQVGG